MSKGRKVLACEAKRMAELYAQGMGITAIGKEMGRAYSTVRDSLLHMGVTLRPVGPCYRLAAAEWDRTLAMYRAGVPLEEMAKVLGITIHGVKWRLDAAGEPYPRAFRYPKRRGTRSKRYQEACNGRSDTRLPGGPLLAWIDGWMARQKAWMPENPRAHVATKPATWGDLAKLAGVAPELRARLKRGEGVSLAVADRVLVAGGSSVLEVYGDVPDDHDLQRP